VLVTGVDGDGLANGDDHCSGHEDLHLASCESPSGTSSWCQHLPNWLESKAGRESRRRQVGVRG
jgi:hypothetical protein